MLRLFICALLVGAFLPGCGGGGAKTFYMHKNTTLGQELSDLQTAYQKGAISENDYEEQRAKLLKGTVTE